MLAKWSWASHFNSLSCPAVKSAYESMRMRKQAGKYSLRYLCSWSLLMDGGEDSGEMCGVEWGKVLLTKSSEHKRSLFISYLLGGQELAHYELAQERDTNDSKPQMAWLSCKEEPEAAAGSGLRSAQSYFQLASQHRAITSWRVNFSSKGQQDTYNFSILATLHITNCWVNTD